MTTTITRSELENLIDRHHPFVLLEALPERYYRHGHLPGARQLPQEQLAERVSALIPDKATDVVVYCASSTCRNSDEAAAELARLGYERVRVYTGGKADWQAAGLPLVRN